jgi:STAS-like domain of unknown function (DUF4325)
MEKIIKVAEEFSRYPAGRYKADGPFSGEKFREEYLRPILEANTTATIELDGVRGYGSSFLEEAFGGLVRIGYDIEKIKSTFTFNSSDSSIIAEIKDYIDHGAEYTI